MSLVREIQLLSANKIRVFFAGCTAGYLFEFEWFYMCYFTHDPKSKI